jgi:hypothetical protein
MSSRSNGRLIHRLSSPELSATKRRDTELRHTDRSDSPIGSVSSERPYLRVETPTAIASSVR